MDTKIEDKTEDISDIVNSTNLITKTTPDVGSKEYRFDIDLRPEQLITLVDVYNKLSKAKDDYEKEQILMNLAANNEFTPDAREYALIKHKIANKETSDTSYINDRTKIWNDRYFREEIIRQISQTRRNSVKNNIQENKSLTLLLFDIDDFKKYNTAHGYEKANKVLYEVAQIAKNYSRGGIACKYGGEEFTVILPETTLEEGMTAGERILKKIREETKEVTASMGVSNYTRDIIDPHYNKKFKRNIEEVREELINKANIALDKAKEGGKDRIVSYSQ